MHRRDFLKAVGLTVLGVPCSSAVSAPADPVSRRPNILVILSDDQGWGDLSHR